MSPRRQRHLEAADLPAGNLAAKGRVRRDVPVLALLRLATCTLIRYHHNHLNPTTLKRKIEVHSGRDRILARGTLFPLPFQEPAASQDLAISFFARENRILAVLTRGQLFSGCGFVCTSVAHEYYYSSPHQRDTMRAVGKEPRARSERHALARNCLRHWRFCFESARLPTCNLGEVASNFNLRCAPSRRSGGVSTRDLRARGKHFTDFLPFHKRHDVAY